MHNIVFELHNDKYELRNIESKMHNSVIPNNLFLELFKICFVKV